MNSMQAAFVAVNVLNTSLTCTGCQTRTIESVLRNVHIGDRPAFSSGRRPEIVVNFEHSICTAFSVGQLLEISY